MAAAQTVLSVDIGNSATKMALVDAAALRIETQVSFPTSSVDQRFHDAWEKLTVGREAVQLAVLSCVSALAGERLSDLLKREGVSEQRFVRGSQPLPIELDYETPSRLGADRIAAACWCAHRFAGKSCAIVGAGTAVTVDYLEAGRVFRGGAIIPGPALQLSALHSGTASLPELTQMDSTAPLPGRSTHACMRGGVMSGLAGAIERIAGEYRVLPRGVSCVLAYGGAWPALAPLVRLEVVHEPDAVLLGTVAATMAIS
jgi:type III pantothenate kinase